MARPQSFDPDEKLEQAMHLFWSRGFAATSIDDLAKNLDISRAGLYRQWISKENLYLQALARYSLVGHQAFLAELEHDPEHSIEIIRRRLIQIVDDGVNDLDSRGCFVVNAICERSAGDTATQDEVASSLARLEDRLGTILAAVPDQVHDGSFDAGAVARFLVVVIQGLRVVVKARPTPEAVAGVVDIAMSAIAPSIPPSSIELRRTSAPQLRT
jgi:TetR/AcrR family transcriptional regulator, transcriptional repressor for nem operon